MFNGLEYDKAQTNADALPLTNDAHTDNTRPTQASLYLPDTHTSDAGELEGRERYELRDLPILRQPLFDLHTADSPADPPRTKAYATDAAARRVADEVGGRSVEERRDGQAQGLEGAEAAPRLSLQDWLSLPPKQRAQCAFDC